MKKLLAFIFIAITFIFAYRPASSAEHMPSLVHSGVQYTVSQAAASDSDYPYIVEEEDALNIFDEATGINAEIIRESLDEEAFDMLRDYYNSSALTNEELFARFTELKKSYVTAMEALYNPNYLNDDAESLETAMRIYYEGSDDLFGLDNCSVYLYNIVQYEGLNNNEQSHLDLIIPVQSTNTVIMIKFTIPLDKLCNTAEGSIAAILSDIRFDGLSPQLEIPSVLYDDSIVKTAQLGIYPAALQEQPDYTLFEDAAAGFSLSLPATYVPFIQNNLGGVFSYTSFKINPNQIFSVSSEPLQCLSTSDAIDRFKAASSSSINVMDSGTSQFGTNIYSYFVYSSSEDELTQYFYDYYIQDESRLYKLQLHCAIVEPGSIVMEQFKRILEGFSSTKNIMPTDATSRSLQSDIAETTKYLNSEEGYSFVYPKSWLLEEISPDIAFDRLRLVIPGLSGALEISIQESELKQNAAFNDIIKSVNGKSIGSWPTLAVNYNPPFAERTSKLLHSDFSIDGAISTIYRLSVFMDDNGRNRLCYSVDILKGHKLYSMFITAGEYKTIEGRFNNAGINELINTVAASFHLENTPESEARKVSGETRNRKLVFVDNYLKHMIDSELVITSVEKTQPDKTLIVTVGNTAESGFYKIKLDYPGRQIEIVDRVIKRNILHKELDSLLEQYGGKIIVDTTLNETDMTITIESLENQVSAPVERSYGVHVSLANSNVVWKTVRLASREDLMRECGLYVNSLFSPDTMVYLSGSYVFKDLEIYRRKSLNYRLMAYSHSDKASGFLMLSMDPRSSLLKADGSFISLEHVVDTITASQYGIERISYYSVVYSFNPDTFILSLMITDNKGKSTAIEQFQIYYYAENCQLEYKKI